MRLPTFLRCTLLLSVLLLTACAVDTASAPPASAPTTAAAPPTSVTSPTSAASRTPTLTAPSPLPATAAPTPSPTAPARGLTAGNLSRLRQLRAIGVGGANLVALSPDGKSLAIGTTAGWILYALPSMRQVRLDFFDEGASGFIWSQDSSMVVVEAYRQVTNSVYRASDGTPIGDVQPPPAAFSPDGKLIVTLVPRSTSVGGPGGTRLPSEVMFTRIDGSTPNQIYSGITTDNSVSFSPDNQLLTTVIDGETQLWKLGATAEGGPLAHVPGTYPVFSPDSSILATTVVSATTTEVRLWRVPSGRAIARFVVDGAPVGLPSIVFSDNGKLLYIVAGHQFQIWNIARGRRVAAMPAPNIYDHLSPDGQVLISYPGGDEQSPRGIRFTRIADAHVLYEDTQAIFAPPGNVTVSADSATAAYVTSGGLVRLIDLLHGTTHDLALPAYFAPTFSPDGQTLATLEGGGAVTLWHVDDSTFTQQLIPTEPLSQSSSLSFRFEKLEFAPDGRSLVAAGYEFTEPVIHVVAVSWDLVGGGPEQTLWDLNMANDDTPTTYLYSLAAHAAAWADRQGIQFQRSGEPAIVLAPPSAASIRSMALSPDGRWLVVADDAGNLQVYRVEPTAVTHTQTLSAASGLRNLAFSQDSKLFGAIQDDGSGLIWRVGEASPLLLYGLAANVTTYNLTSFAILPDQQMLIAGRQDDTAFYRISDGQEMGTIPVHSWELAISPNGDRFAVAVGGRILLWGVAP